MFGLFDQFNTDDPTKQARLAQSLALLEAGGPSRVPVSLFQGLGMAGKAGLEAKRQAQKDAQAKLLMDLQLKDLTQKTKASESVQEILGNIFGGSPSGALASGAAVGDVGPTNTNAARMNNGGMANLTLDQVARLHALGGPNLMDAYKFAHTPQTLQGGTFSQNPVTKQREWIPKLDEGMAPGANGVVGNLPGYVESLADKTGAVKGAEAASTSPYELVDVPRSDGSIMKVPKNVALQMLGGQTSQAPQSRQPTALELEAILADAKKRGVTGPLNINFTQNKPETGVTQSPAAAAAAKTKAEADEKRTAEIETKRQADIKQAQKFIQVATQADALLKAGPTGSGIGSAVDTLGGVIGYSVPGAAEADSLRTIGAWLTGNVPRFEGPQSNVDVGFYMKMAADVGNDKLPIERRQAALAQVKAMMENVIKSNGGAQTDDAPAAPPSKPSLRWNPKTQKLEAVKG